MIDPKELLKAFLKEKISFFSGVPDSVLRNFTELLDSNKKIKHIVGVNEGSSLSINIGNYLSTKKLGLVYLQNSGLGNIVNPIVSVADKEVYSIPIVLLIGWRGAPNTKDEPQHLTQGKITRKLLKILKIKYCEISASSDLFKIRRIINYSKKHKVPVAVLIKKGKIAENKIFLDNLKLEKGINRKSFLENLLKKINKTDRVISTTGYTSREIFQIRKLNKKLNGKDFYMVGGMGHAGSVALGFSMKQKINKNVICIDGDGSFLMHMGSQLTISNYSNKNFKYVLLNNNCHESVGVQKTFANNIDFKKFAKALKFKNYYNIKSINENNGKLDKFLKSSGPSFLEVKIASGTIKNLTRPRKLKNIMKNFMKN